MRDKAGEAGRWEGQVQTKSSRKQTGERGKNFESDVTPIQMQLRVVPLDRLGRQEAWVPEFLFTVERITGDEVAAEKWWKAIVTPAQPE